MNEVIMLDVKDVKPYEKNARKNDEAVRYVAESIKQFGFRQPIIVDKDHVIICGHTRAKAAKKLGLKKVPCIVAADLTEEQVKAYRLADNKVAEKAEWDFELLDAEIESLPEFDFEDFGFEFDIETEDEEPPKKKNERLRTDEAYNLPYVDLSRCAGKYEMPVIDREDHIPDSLIGFNYALTSKDKSAGIACYVDDYQIERLFNQPERYIDILRQYDCFLTPDYSLYMDMPKAMQIWNVFRSRLVGQIMQDAGITVIPTVSWSDAESFDFCFDGLPENATLSISTVGVMRYPEAIKLWKAGVTELIKRKHPKTLLIWGNPIDYDFGDIKVIYYKNGVTERMKESRKKTSPKGEGKS